jgi:hypothetical protein
MKRTILISLALVTACAASAVAAETDGSVTLGGNVANVTGNKAKASEYHSLDSGVFGGINLGYRSPETFLDVDGYLKITDGDADRVKQNNENDLLIKGGMTDVAKFSLLYNVTPHNITFGAKTFLYVPGTNVLISAVPPPTVPTAANSAGLMTSFDYFTSRTNYGAEMELSLKSPFFFSAGFNRTKIDGTQPFAFTTALREVPAPVDYTTDTTTLQAGYRSKDLIATLDGTFSNFTNSNQLLAIGAIGAGPAGFAYLPPDNDAYKIGGSVMYKLPFWSTTMMARGSHSVLESNPTLYEGPPIMIGTNWSGKRTYDSASASITSSPIKDLNTRIYYNYLDNHTASMPMIYQTGALNTQYNNPISQVGYTKQNGGIDLTYAVPDATKVSVGYEYGDVRRSTWATNASLLAAGSLYATKTADNTLYAQVKSTLSDTLSGKVRYEHLFRNSGYPYYSAYVPATNRAAYFMPFEAADKGMDAVKVELEYEPLHGLSLGLQYAYKMNDYKNSALGVNDDTRNELYVDATYVAGIAKLNVYGEAETVETNATYFAGTIGSPMTATNNFLYKSKRNDINYAGGGKVAVEILRDRLTFTTGYRYERANGSNDFSVSNAAIMTTPYWNATPLDDYIKQSLTAKLTYNATKDWSFDLGYLYEHLKYADAAYTNYTYVVGTNYLTGAYNNPNYDASVFYLSTKYKF